ncbi:HAD family hydrolase [Epilithonimonas sp. JDS]|uniref:HAD family hydrolase n=1 Tax=Epilithonimonas sp. JDS TaxID=2902797 RepID=UPI001E434F8B|nr:HAD family hydrolase [Epilithonimonas sp. JDS]MCD9854111.1 HAD family hydrolase [Epilithonimonas sp. JDS]
MIEERDSLIFDLDGTLWDASETVVRAFNDSILEIGFDINLNALDIRNFSGMKMDDIFAQHFNFIPKEKLQNFETIYSIREKKYLNESGGRLFPQVRETLEKLSKTHRLFIVSNCLSGYIESFLDFYDLNPYFEDFECFGNRGLPKDENIRLIVTRNELQNPVYIGDTIWDKESSEKAGVDFIYAAYGFGKIENAEYQIENFEDLLTT